MREKKKNERKYLKDIKSISHLNEILTESQTKERLEIEIGCGNGHFITHYGEKNPSTYLIGIEIKKSRCLKILKKVKNKNLYNIEVIQGKAEDLIEKLPFSSIDVVHIYFPDPWPKARHRKRRFFRKPYLDLLSNCLKSGGRVNFATDYFDYALQAKILLSLHSDFSLIKSAPPEEIFLSVYANKFKRLDRPVRFISAIKV
ncbi:MAG: tRNA (guanosine(46)-N7)-methyltransferase TrmB [Spirochaetales bacterium]|nr:tRNA (guanosine(46)-N7)-methyltransferase TrmB [Spirochaetales bacterium]